MRRLLAILLALAVASLLASLASSQGRPDSGALMAAQRAALRPLAMMDGVWRGTARIQDESGSWREHAQTERVGPMLDSTLKVIEGRGYDADGKKVFNAFAVLSWDSAKKAFVFRSYTRGLSGDFAFTPTDSGYVWEIPAGPVTIRYTAAIRDGKWREVGDRIVPGQEPIRFIEMNLQREGSSDWPAGGAVPPR